MAVFTKTLLDVVNTVGFRVGNFKVRLDSLENPDLATVQMIECINETIREIIRVKPLPYMDGRTVISTVPLYNTGTVTVTNGQTAVTGSGTTFTAAMVGRAFAINTVNATYRIANYVSATSIILDEPWSGDTATGVAFTIAQDRYDLPTDFYDFITASIEGDQVRRVEIQPPSNIDFHRMMMLGKVMDPGSPRRLTVYDRGPTTGNWMIETDVFSDKSYRIVVRYKRRHTSLSRDNDLVPIGDEHIGVVYRGAVACWREATGGVDVMGLFRKWIDSELAVWAAMDVKTTDEQQRVVPSDTMRSDRPVVGPLDWGPNR